MAKKIFFYFLLFACACVVVEILSAIVHIAVSGKIGFYSEIARRKSLSALDSNGVQERTVSPIGTKNGSIRTIYHPYLGYVRDPNDFPNFTTLRYHNLFDFPNIAPRKQKDRLLILITGGSVAGGLGTRGLPYLLDTLSRFPQFRDKTIEVYNASNGGYKQPQQLMSLMLLLSMGAQFDVAINFDGFNDIVLPVAENLPNHVSPFYPRRWDLMTGDISDREWLKKVGRKLVLEEQRTKWASFFSKGPIKMSPTLNLVWMIRDNVLTRAIDRSLLDVQSHGVERTPLASRGPEYPKKNKDEMYEELASYWSQCSNQMDLICRENGIRYFHFLQPNQYVADSKPFSDEEKHRYLNNPLYKNPASEGYAYLIQSGEKLRERGVSYFDLTFLFEGVDETVYQDDCCHFNELGRETIARQIGQIVGLEFSKQRNRENPPAFTTPPQTRLIEVSRHKNTSRLILSQGCGGMNLVKCLMYSRKDKIPVMGNSFFANSYNRQRRAEGGEGRATYVSTGDINQDGDSDLIVSFGPIGAPADYPNRIVVFDMQSLRPIGHPFAAFFTGSDRPTKYDRGEILTTVGCFMKPDEALIAAAQGIGGRGMVRLYHYTGLLAPNGFKVAGQFFGLDGKAQTGNANGGQRLASGDLDGDGVDELIVSQSYSETSRALFQVLKIDERGRVDRRIGFSAFPENTIIGGAGADMTVCDIDGDGQNEIVAASQGPGVRSRESMNCISIIRPVIRDGEIAGFEYIPGGVFGVFTEEENPSGMVSLSSGDLDNNPENGDELVVGTGSLTIVDGLDVRLQKPAPRSLYRIMKVVKKDGSYQLTDLSPKIEAFEGDLDPSSGAVNVSVSQ